MNVEKLMSKTLHTCRIGDRLDQPARAMWEEDIGSIPVLDPESNVVGIITDRDICMAAYTQGKPLAAIPVASAMGRSVVTCKPTDDITTAAKLLRQHRIHRLPVVAPDGKLAGVLSLNDLARFVARQRGKVPPELVIDDLVDTMAAICQPRWVRTPSGPTPEAAAATQQKPRPRVATAGMS